MHVLLLGLNYYPDKLGNAPLMTGLCEDLWPVVTGSL